MILLNLSAGSGHSRPTIVGNDCYDTCSASLLLLHGDQEKSRVSCALHTVIYCSIP